MKVLRLNEKEREWLVRAISECNVTLSESCEYEEDWSHPYEKDMAFLEKLQDKIQRL